MENELHELQGIVREGDRLTYKGKKYVRETSTFFCEVTELLLIEGYLQVIPGLGGEPKIKPSFHGKARLETDTICVVDACPKEITELELSIDLVDSQSVFTLVTEAQRAAKAARDEERQQQEPCHQSDWRDAIYGQDAITKISFMESFWLHIYAPQVLFDALRSAFEARRLYGVLLGVKCGLWVEESSADLLVKKRFLFPERVSESGNLVFERTYGWLSRFDITSAPLRLGIQDEDPSPPAITAADRRMWRNILCVLWSFIALAVLALIYAGSR